MSDIQFSNTDIKPVEFQTEVEYKDRSNPTDPYIVAGLVSQESDIKY